MESTKQPRDPQRHYYRRRVRWHIENYLNAHPEAARPLALEMCDLMCRRMIVQDLKDWSLSLTFKLECPFLAKRPGKLDAKPDDSS